nr:hypothetical protein [Microvirga soli]
MGTDCDPTRGLSYSIQADLALKPLPLLIDEGDESDWSIADVSGNLCEIVEGSLGFGI